eukprot:6704085-Pyramimonas_sp.AAC.2
MFNIPSEGRKRGKMVFGRLPRVKLFYNFAIAKACLEGGGGSYIVDPVPRAMIAYICVSLGRSHQESVGQTQIASLHKQCNLRPC